MSTQVISTAIHAPIGVVYQAITNPELIAKWRVPDNMTGSVDRTRQAIDGSFAINHAYTDDAKAGKTTAGRDTYRSRFVKLRENELVVEKVEFESLDPALRTSMTVTTTLKQLPSATLVTLTFKNIPAGVSQTGYQKETRMALLKLSKLVAQNAS
jgi:uncharacterized protein YndB with AHSA1/START domain